MKGVFALFCYVLGSVRAGALAHRSQGADTTDLSTRSQHDCTEVLGECTPCIEQQKRWQVEQCGETGLHKKFRCKDGKEEFFRCEYIARCVYVEVQTISLLKCECHNLNIVLCDNICSCKCLSHCLA
jgi:hypothetical protein